MTKEDVYRRINRYLDGISTSPILVDVPSYAAKAALLKQFTVDGIGITDASSFCATDELLQWDTLRHELATKNSSSFLDGLCDFMKLEGADSINRQLQQLLELYGQSKTVIITVGCSKWFQFRDLRLVAQGKLSVIDGEPEPVKSLVFIRPGLAEPSLCIEGLNHLPRLCNFPGYQATIITSHNASDFPNSLYDIKVLESRYEVIMTIWSNLKILKEDFGSKDQWDRLYEILIEKESFEDSLSYFGGRTGLAQAISRFEDMDSFDQWFYLLCLKIVGTEENRYLSKAARQSNSVSEFVEHIYQDILEINPNSSNFSKTYSERRSLLSHLVQYPDADDKFCKMVWVKEDKALAYLTDTSNKEKECIIAFLAKYGSDMGRKTVMSYLEMVYPALYSYLSDYPYGNPLLDKYFREYKFNKTVNIISDEMRRMTEEQATRRDFNAILKPRSLVVDGINAEGSVLYFIDALGAEYLSYLQTRFFENGFDFSAQVARCELPSITSVNKDFVRSFQNLGCKVVSKKELDELKHEGGDSYDYQDSKLPIHIITELEIIDKLVLYLKGTLQKGERAFIIADHGTSRLAVINEKENKWELSEKGKHSGRCCPVSDIDDKPETATESNDFWCLANYDRFKGGRKALVEVHGGATLEEVTIPIIEVSKRDKSIACNVRNEGPALRGLKTFPILKLFVEKECPDIEVEIDGTKYPSRGCSVPYVHEFELSGIRRAGIYKFNVYCQNVLIACGLEIEVANQGARERSFF